MAIIKYQSGVVKLSTYWETFLRTLLDKYGIPEMTISSSYRNPAQQAKAMYDNILSFGVAAEKSLYRNGNGGKVIDVYVADKAAGKSVSDTLSDMAAKISAVGHVSAHNILSPDFIAIDVPPQLIPAQYQGQFKAAMASASSHFVPQGTTGEPVHHIEFTKGFKAAIQTGAKVLPLLLLVAGAYLYFRSQR